MDGGANATICKMELGRDLLVPNPEQEIVGYTPTVGRATVGSV